MTTITFEKDVSLWRDTFKDTNDFFLYILENYSVKENKIEVWVLKKSEKNASLTRNINMAKSWKIHFNNI